MKALIRSAALGFAALAVGCAAMVPMQSARLGPLPVGSPPTRLEIEPVEIRLSTGYARTLPADRWEWIGNLPQGRVYRPVDSVFSLEGRHVHEAYLVLDGATLRGFYLPVEAAFSPLEPTISLKTGGSK